MIRINLLGTQKGKNKRSAASAATVMEVGDVGSPTMKVLVVLALAGLVNLAGNFSTSSVNENGLVYSGLGDATRFNDILTGTAGSHHAAAGWDFVTGVGTPNGLIGK